MIRCDSERRVNEAFTSNPNYKLIFANPRIVYDKYHPPRMSHFLI